MLRSHAQVKCLQSRKLGNIFQTGISEPVATLQIKMFKISQNCSAGKAGTGDLVAAGHNKRNKKRQCCNTRQTSIRNLTAHAKV